MKLKQDAFSSCHPIINFYYFAVAILCAMFFLHPILSPVSLIIAVIYSIYLNGKKAVKFNLLGMLPVMFFATIANPLFNHAGITMLFYLENGNPVTLEAIVYGVASGCMLVTVIIWFSCYNAVMTSDKFIYLFGKIIPVLSLIFSMVLRFVPKFKMQIKVISNAQRCIGRDVSQGNIFSRIKNGLAILSIFITWVLENAIETADSMKSRGYGLKKRTAFSNFRFTQRDVILLCILSVCLIFIVAGIVLNITNMKFFPMIIINEITPISIMVYFAYLILLGVPIVIGVLEDIKWKYIQSGN